MISRYAYSNIVIDYGLKLTGITNEVIFNRFRKLLVLNG